MKLPCLLFYALWYISTSSLVAQEPRFAWKFIGPDGGTVQCFLETDSVLFVGTSAGLFRSVDNGSSWNIAENGLGTLPYSVGQLAFSQGRVFVTLGNVVGIGAASTDNYVYASDNFGQTWYRMFPDQILNNERFDFVSLLNAVDSVLVLGITQSVFDAGPSRTTFWRSIDKGRTWTATQGIIAKATDFYTIPLPRQGNSLLRAGKTLFLPDRERSLICSDDNGLNWQSVSASVPSRRQSFGNPLVVPVFSKNTLFWGIDSVLFVSQDTGRTWTGKNVQPTSIVNEKIPLKIRSLAVMSDTLLLTLQQEILQSQPVKGITIVSGNQGDTWLERSSSQTIPNSLPLLLLPTRRSLFLIPSDTELGGSTNGLWRSNDIARSWQPAYQGVQGFSLSRFISARQGLFAFDTQSGRSAIVGTNGVTRIISSNPQSRPVEFFALDTILYASSGIAFFRSLDNARTWQEIMPADTNLLRNRLQYPLAFQGVLVGFVTTSDKQFRFQSRWVRSTDTGRTWQTIARLSTVRSPNIRGMALDTAGKRLYIYQNDTLFQSSDVGITWNVSSDTSEFQRASSIHASNTWIQSEWNPTSILYTPLPALYSNDNGRTFAPSFLGLPNTLRIPHLIRQGTMLYAATSRGVYVADISTSVTQCQTFTSTSLSVRCTPNPAQDAVLLTYTLPTASTVRYEVLDMLGRVLTFSPEQERGVGEQSIVLSTEQFPSGVYAVRVLTRSAAGLRTETARLLVVR